MGELATILKGISKGVTAYRNVKSEQLLGDMVRGGVTLEEASMDKNIFKVIQAAKAIDSASTVSKFNILVKYLVDGIKSKDNLNNDKFMQTTSLLSELSDEELRLLSVLDYFWVKNKEGSGSGNILIAELDEVFGWNEELVSAKFTRLQRTGLCQFSGVFGRGSSAPTLSPLYQDIRYYVELIYSQQH
jgi:hypothetical protein